MWRWDWTSGRPQRPPGQPVSDRAKPDRPPPGGSGVTPPDAPDERIGGTESTAPTGPHCRYCGADCSQDRSWDGGDLYACPSCADARAAAWKATSAKTPYLGSSMTVKPRALCPNLLSIRDIGEADGWRGRVVRGFFRVLRVVTGL